MTPPVVLLPKATQAFASAMDYYDAARPGHGMLFLLEVERTIDIVVHWPEAYPLVTLRLRRAPIRRFSETIVYRPFPDFVRVLDIVADRRDPAILASLNFS